MSVVKQIDVNKVDGSEEKYPQEKIQFPYEIKKLDPELNLQLMKDFNGDPTAFIQIGPQKWFFNSEFEKDLEYLYNFKFREDDVVLCGYPRSGTTLTQEMLWLLSNDLNYLKASEVPSFQRVSQLEESSLLHNKMRDAVLATNIPEPEKIKAIRSANYQSWKELADSKEKRFIKTHVPFSLIQSNITEVGCKIIYVARNPKDVAVSNYHLSRLLVFNKYSDHFRTYWNYFEKNLRTFSPYWEHIKEGWNRRHEKNVLFMFYEDITKDLKGTIEKVATFLEKTYTPEEVEQLENHLKFDNFKNNASVNLAPLRNLGLLREGEEGFIRRGKASGWKDYFDEELEKQANQWIKENLKGTDIVFPS